MARFFGNLTGAFSDGAILFPLLAVLSQSSFSSSRLLLSAGIAYWFAGLFFRVPMSVQPLKAIAIAVAVSGASLLEVRISGALVGLFCLALLASNVNQLISRIPRVFIHGIQLGLGVLLIRKGLELFWLSPWGMPETLAATGLVVLVILTPRLATLGIVATGIFLYAAFTTRNSGVPSITADTFSAWTVLALSIPQMVLTSANSVVATFDLSHRYFGKNAARVTPQRLLLSIGAGNILSSLFAGLPFCHGAGGLTAHYRGGSHTWISNAIIGTALVAMALFQERLGISHVVYPPAWLAALLLLIGYFHATLCLPSWTNAENRVILLSMGVAALISGNMLIVLVSGLAVHALTFRKQIEVTA